MSGDVRDRGRVRHRRRAPVGWAAALVALAILSALAPARGAGGEELLVKGMGRTLGWIVATEEGELRFRDCQGRLTTVRDGRIESTTRRCQRIGDGVEVVGAVRALDPVARILLTEDSSGRVHGFYLEDAVFDAPSLLDVKPGQSVRVTGPVAGRATRIERR